jgi:16S rRNA (guanine527-N7)-methyltransferase
VESGLDLYLRELRRWGERTNLVGSLEPEALRAHLQDALTAAPHLPKGARVVDLGSGAGLPGVPIAVARPDLDVTLVEIRERRVHFLRHVVRTLGIECHVERTRIEDPPEDLFEVALLRAVAPPLEAVALARPWVREAGEIWVWTTEPSEALPWAQKPPIALPRGAVLRILVASSS